MQFASYKEICKTPATQSAFLEGLTVALEGLPAASQDWQRRAAVAAVQVDGKPFSISKYLATTELSSQDWDIEDGDTALRGFVAAAIKMMSTHPDINVPEFTHRFASMPGADAVAYEHPRQAATSEHYSGTFCAPTLGSTVLSSRVIGAREREETAKRAMRPR